MGGTAGEYVEVQPGESKLEVDPIPRLKRQEESTTISCRSDVHDASSFLGWGSWIAVQVTDGMTGRYSNPERGGNSRSA
jgi:hypothetical protein